MVQQHISKAKTAIHYHNITETKNGDSSQAKLQRKKDCAGKKERRNSFLLISICI